MGGYGFPMLRMSVGACHAIVKSENVSIGTDEVMLCVRDPKSLGSDQEVIEV